MNRLLLIIHCILLCNAIAHGQSILSLKEEKEKAVFITSEGELQLIPLADNAVRVKYTKQTVRQLPELVYLPQKAIPYSVKSKKKEFVISLPQLRIVLDKQTGCLSYFSQKGELLLKEDGRLIKDSYIQGEKCYSVRQTFHSPKDEYLYGLGQFQDGYLNLRGLSRRLTQVNTQIAIPFLLSSKEYALLWNNYGLTEFNPGDSHVALSRKTTEGQKTEVSVTSTEGTKKEIRENNSFGTTMNIPVTGRYAILLDVGQKMARRHHLVIDGKEIINVKNIWLPPTTSAIVELKAGTHTISANLEKGDKPEISYKLIDDKTTFQSPVASLLDYTFFSGKADEVISTYRKLTGEVPMMPMWALGYIHCRERFHSQQELIHTAQRLRKEKYPMDVMVQDWMYWGNYGWNAMQFDESHYPNPKVLVDSLHLMNARLMLSVWSKIDPSSEVGNRMNEKGYFIPNTTWVDFFNPEAAQFYWKNFSDKLLKPYGIDAWWQDATEPENDDLAGRKIMKGTMPGEFFRNVYPLFVNKTVYEGLRKDAPEKRAMILTRSGFPGMQRYGAATWSGDVGYDWETFRRQIAGGLNMMASGLPWWTYDAGGFFRPSNQYTDPGYHECFLRWLQTSVFLPIMRVHGYQSDTEFWNYGKLVTEQAHQSLKVRYQLFPYIYSESAAISLKGSTLMRPLVMDFTHDPTALKQKYEYMFGPSLLIAPVVEPGRKEWDVYLPQVRGGWYDFWTEKHMSKNGWNQIPVSLNHIPVFVKAGSIVPLATGDLQSTIEAADADWTIKVFTGADGSYSVYEDEGVNYNYEKGFYSIIKMRWDNKNNKLTLSARKGTFPGINKERRIKVIKVSSSCMQEKREIIYSGKELAVQF